MDAELLDRIESAIRRDGRYPPDAFAFLHSGLQAAAELKHRANRGRRARHVSGQELCQALRLLALTRWGPLARDVLRSWNIRNTRDFGEMVYFMINLMIMGKQDSDDISDFDDVYDFDQAFSQYEIDVAPKDE